ncbi:MAG TPA: cupin domain-containing protein [Terriglobales bacterium]|nr:cupin domain-containing protein [Terriglobales bacterium]
MDRRSFLNMALAAVPALAVAQEQGSKPEPKIEPKQDAGKSGGAVVVAAGKDRYGMERPRPFGTSAFKVATQDSGGDMFVMEHRLTVKGGPPLHLHHGEDELFYIMEGDFLFEIGGRRFKAGPGDSVLGPKGIPHTWAFVGNTPGKMLFVFAPAGKMEDFFAERDRRGGGLVEDAAFLKKYGMELLGPRLKIE